MSLGIRTSIKLARINRIWRKRNKHNQTSISNFFDLSLVSVRSGSYGGIRIISSGSQGHLSIGNYCSIAPEVSFVLNNDHRSDLVSTFPFKIKCLNQNIVEAVSKGGIIVDDDVWIGYRAIILDGVHIGQGAIVAAGAVVANDVPPYAIVGGVPAKIIRMRFDDETIAALMAVDYGEIDREFVEDNLELFYKSADKELVLKLVTMLQK